MNQMKSLLKSHFRSYIEQFRYQNHLSQEGMAEKLFISTRSYIDLEHGKCCCSALSLLFFLENLSDQECVQFIREFKRMVERSMDNDVA